MSYRVLHVCFRIDIDHSARYLAQKFYAIRDPDYYEFEGTYMVTVNVMLLLLRIKITKKRNARISQC